MPEKHSVGGTHFGNFIESAAYEVSSSLRKAFLWKIRWFTINDCLKILLACGITMSDGGNTHAELTENVVVGFGWIGISAQGALDNAEP